VDAKALVAKGLIRDEKLPVKVLGTGDLTKKLTVNAAKFSATAKTKIEKAGGTAAEAA
jgi:large subunit ribosomal protein L15